jgi:hypothetical protein
MHKAAYWQGIGQRQGSEPKKPLCKNREYHSSSGHLFKDSQIAMIKQGMGIGIFGGRTAKRALAGNGFTWF